jgi:hypothetical protein
LALRDVRHTLHTGGSDLGLGFKKARARVVKSLESGNYGHQYREDGFLKNWLQYERVSEAKVVQLLKRCNGEQYRPGKQMSPAGTEVHEFFPREGEVGWYIKAYLYDDSEIAVIAAVFISGHPSGIRYEDLEAG